MNLGQGGGAVEPHTLEVSKKSGKIFEELLKFSYKPDTMAAKFLKNMAILVQ